jgi:hypothetical protein
MPPLAWATSLELAGVAWPALLELAGATCPLLELPGFAWPLLELPGAAWPMLLELAPLPMLELDPGTVWPMLLELPVTGVPPISAPPIPACSPVPLELPGTLSPSELPGKAVPSLELPGKANPSELEVVKPAISGVVSDPGPVAVDSESSQLVSANMPVKTTTLSSFLFAIRPPFQKHF